MHMPACTVVTCGIYPEAPQQFYAHANMHGGYKVRAYMEGAASIHSGAGGAVGTSTIEPAESTAD